MEGKLFKKVLVANRGEIACRIIRTLSKLGISSVAVYSDADRGAAHVSMATESVYIGNSPAESSYLKVDAIINAALQTGAQAIHPGYGFLSENAALAETCEANGIKFIGPTPHQIREFGLKHTARALAKRMKVPMLPGTELLETKEEAVEAAASIGYPVILKATAGGGGIGMRVCHDAAELTEGFEVVKHLSATNFATVGVYLEKYVARARHVEVQIFGDGKEVVCLGDRDCSSQRRNQKVVEEAPAPRISEATRTQLFQAARAMGMATEPPYCSAGTVEFVYDEDADEFHFLEVNTRLQVEHGVTELLTGIDIVEWMVRGAAGDLPPLHTLPVRSEGHAIQARIYAEDPAKNFQPSSGELSHVAFPTAPEVRVDSWIESGTEVSPYYDPLLAKVMVKADSRDAAVAALVRALSDVSIQGIECNVEYLKHVVTCADFVTGRVSTRMLNELVYLPATINVVAAGSFTTVQDYPGRLGYWDIGVPPSGPMDHLAFRLGNRCLGNEEGAPGLEMTMQGPTLRFNLPATICLAGAVAPAKLGPHGGPQREVATYTPTAVAAGETLTIGRVPGPGIRAYLLFGGGGLDVPSYYGSKSTFTLGKFGGHAGRTLLPGDVLRLEAGKKGNPALSGAVGVAGAARVVSGGLPLGTRLDERLIPQLTTSWEVGVLPGPHCAPDFFLPEDIEMLHNTEWKTHYNSARTGVRLIGPKPKWARPSGGEAGLHPSNTHDVAYAIGSVCFTGDMPIFLGHDGPSLGGFACPCVIAKAEMWKLGQLAPNDTVKLVPMAHGAANALEKRQEAALASLQVPEVEDLGEGITASTHASTSWPLASITAVGGDHLNPVLGAVEADASKGSPGALYRRAGDKNILVEYGPNVLDVDLRFRVHALMAAIKANEPPGIIDMTPGIRSVMIHYDCRVTPVGTLLSHLAAVEATLPPVDDMEVPQRIVRLPISWNDPAVQLCISKYMQSVRDDAPWCPSNIEFIRRINGLDSIERVREIFFAARWLVMGLGDVYLGAPLAVALDPRHRLVTTKYNPVRTWTPDNVVGIGGCYLCIYGMEGPGGYQLVGRTVPVWSRYRSTGDFAPGKPWLLRFFDVLEFYEVTHEELMTFRSGVANGTIKLDVKETTFKLKDYHAFLASIKEESAAFRSKREIAFNEERERWVASGEFAAVEEMADAAAGGKAPSTEVDVPEGGALVASPMVANVWKVDVTVGQVVEEGSSLVVLEAMKMETSIPATMSGVVVKVLCAAGSMVQQGTPLVVLGPAQ
eukprot:jgi/Mesvir1/1876/Mv22912-RA.2